MPKIRMQAVSSPTIEECFKQFLAAAAARGVTEKTLESYKQHFKSMSMRLDVSSFIHLFNKNDVESMIFEMRNQHLADTTINSYTRTLKFFCLGAMKKDSRSILRCYLSRVFLQSDTYV